MPELKKKMIELKSLKKLSILLIVLQIISNTALNAQIQSPLLLRMPLLYLKLMLLHQRLMQPYLKQMPLQVRLLHQLMLQPTLQVQPLVKRLGKPQ